MGDALGDDRRLSIRLIRGAAGSGKTQLVLAEFREALAKDRAGARLVVPTATLVRHLRNELARDGAVFPPNAVVSLSRFASERAGDAKLLPAGLLQAIVADALRQLRLPEFARVAETRGMAATVLDAIQRLENAGAKPDSIRGNPGPELKALVRVWQAVASAVDRLGYVTRAGMLRRAAANTSPSRVYMDGFLAFSPVESELLRSVAQHGELTLTLRDGEGARQTLQLALQLGASDRLLSGPARAPNRVMVEAVSAEREADEIARRVIELHSRGVALREIAVALRDPATYVSLLQATFERFGIPARFYFEKPLETHPAALFLSGLVEGALHGWEFEATLDTLRAHPRWGKSADFDRFDFRVREHMPGHGALALTELCEPDWLRKELETCLRTERWVGSPTTPEAWLSRFERMAEALYPLQFRLENFSSVESARSHSAAIAAWLSAVEDAAAFWPSGHGAVTLQQFWDVVGQTISGATYSTPDDRRDVVHILQAYEARQWDVRVLIVCGATDRAYPQRRAPNALLGDEAVRWLRGKGVPLRSAEEEEADEIALGHALQTRATETLIFTFPLQDAGGRGLKATRLVEQAPRVKAKLVRPAGLPTPLAAANPGRVETPALLGALNERHKLVSLTSIEKLMQCRFQFFADRTLELKGRPQRPNERLEARIGGLILHEALEHWQEDLTQDFPALFETAFEEAVRKHRLPAGYRLEVERLTLRRIAAQVAAKQRWEPLETRVEVPLTIGFPGGITANCRVDRIDDLGDGRCIIIDYKAGKVNNVRKLVDSQISLQGPLYARAVRDGLNLKTTAMIFWAVREDRMVGWGDPSLADELIPMPSGWMDDAYSRASERLADFLLGHIKAEPTDPARCRWCDYADTCRVEERKAELTQIAGSHGA